MEQPPVACELFQVLPEPIRDRLAAVCRIHRCRKGAVIFEEGRPAVSVWIVQRGCVYIVKRTPGGGTATIFAITPEEALCGISALDRQAYAGGGVAATQSQLLEIPAETFSHLLKAYPEFASRVLLTCCTRMRHMAEAISLGQAPVQQRLAYALLRLRSTFGNTIPVTHQELARMAGTRWETSIRTLATLRRRGWLASRRGQVTILKPQQLKELLQTTH